MIKMGGWQPTRRELLWLCLLAVMAWWSWPEAEPPPPSPEQLSHQQMQAELRRITDPWASIPGDDDGAPPPTLRLAPVSEPEAASAVGMQALVPGLPTGLSRSDRPADVCQRWSGGNEPWPDDERLARDSEAASVRFWQDLLSRPDPLLRAVGMFALHMHDALLGLALGESDPRVTVVALTDAVNLDWELEQRYYDERLPRPDPDEPLEVWQAYRAQRDALPPYQPLGVLMQLALRWAALEPNNAMAWLALADQALKVGDAVQMELALKRMAGARDYNKYTNLISSLSIQQMSAEYTWWQRAELIRALDGDAEWASSPIAAYRYCRPDQTTLYPERLPLCKQLGSLMLERSGDGLDVQLALIFGDATGRSSTELDARWKNLMKGRRLFWRWMDRQNPNRGCESLVRLHQTFLRAAQEDGDLRILEELGARAPDMPQDDWRYQRPRPRPPAN